MARVADATGADIEAVIAGIGLDTRIGTAFLKPGPGIGGSCLPEQAVAIALQTAALDVEAPLLSSVHRSNAVHQREIVARLEALLGGPGSLVGRRIALLGLAFKADTDDVRESPALALAANLRAAGADVLTHDPRAERRARLADPTLVVAPTALEALRGAEAVVVVTEWAEYGAIDWVAAAAAMRGTLVYDTRGVVDVEAARRAGPPRRAPGPAAAPVSPRPASRPLASAAAASSRQRRVERHQLRRLRLPVPAVVRRAKAARAQVGQLGRVKVEDRADRRRDRGGIGRIAHRAERPVRVVEHDPAHLEEVADHDRQPGRDRFEELVRARQAVVERARLDRHHADVGRRDPGRQDVRRHGLEHVQPSAEARLGRQLPEGRLERSVAEEDRVHGLHARAGGSASASSSRPRCGEKAPW